MLLSDRVKDTTTSTGTGNLTLAGAPPSTFRSFNAEIGTGHSFEAFVHTDDYTDWEIAACHLSAATTLVRDALRESSTGSTVSFAAGTKTVRLVISAAILNGVMAADIASAATVDLGLATGRYVNITGATGPITSFGTVPAGQVFYLRFASTPTLTHNATSLILPTGADITAIADDTAIVVSLGSGNFRCLQFNRKSGQPVTTVAIATGGTGATSAAAAFAALKQDATTSATGVSELLTTAELLGGTDTTRTATADAVAALWELAADITDGAAITLGDGGSFSLITSTTAITSFVFTVSKAGRKAIVRFNTARTLTHNATSLIITPGGASITTAAGDICEVEDLGSGNVRVNWYTPATGQPVPIVSLAKGGTGAALSDPNDDRIMMWDDSAGAVVLFDNDATITIGASTWGVTPASDTQAGALEIAVQSEMETGTSTTLAVVPGRMQYHPAMAKCWGKATVSGGTPTLQENYNIASITDTATGQLTWTIGTDFAGANWACLATVEGASTALANTDIRSTRLRSATQAAGSIIQECHDDTSTTKLLADPGDWNMVGFGDQA
jgi:hypothetical protein